jgi:hypothetical protein
MLPLIAALMQRTATGKDYGVSVLSGPFSVAVLSDLQIPDRSFRQESAIRKEHQSGRIRSRRHP